MSTRGRWAVALLGVVAFTACDESDVHIYSAQQFESDPKRRCLEAAVAIDVVNGGSTSYGCAPECLVATGPCGKPYVFVSTQCGPYPEGLVTQGQGEAGDASDLCEPAFDAGMCDGEADDAGDAGAGDAMMGCD